MYICYKRKRKVKLSYIILIVFFFYGHFLQSELIIYFKEKSEKYKEE